MDGPGGGSDGEDDMVGVVVGVAGLASAPGPGVGVARVSAGVVLPKPFLTSSREDVTVLAPLETGAGGPLTCLCLGSTGSTAFLARSRRAAAKVDLLLEGAGDTDRWGVWAGGGGPGRPGDGDDGTDWGRTPLERSGVWKGWGWGRPR